MTAGAARAADRRAPRQQETRAPERTIVARMRTAAAAEADDSDAALLRRYAVGDHAAARVLTARHAPRVFALARRTLGETAEAEDVTQETMLRLWRIAPDWQADRAALGTWLYRVATNLCIDRLRRRRETGGNALPELADDAPGPEQRLVAGDRAAALSAAMSALPDRQRLAIVLRHFEERGNPEIATILGISVEAVESLLARGRRELAARLAPQREELGFSDG
jgi:RNA polymerase sigma-70 factor, ECF subfamily